MIARVNTPARRARFRNACRGRWVLDTLLPLDQQIFGKSQPGRFYAGPTLALELSGRTAWAAGHANPEELASFLAFCGCGSVILDEGVCPPPTGWHRAETLTVFGLAPGKVLPLPAVEDALWSSLTLDAQPPADAFAAQGLCRLAAGHVGLSVCDRIGAHGAHRLLALLQRPDHGPAPAALGAQL